MKNAPLLAALMLAGAPAAAQRTDAPLGEILEVIEEELAAEPSSEPPASTAEPPASSAPTAPLQTRGIGTIELPASDAEVTAPTEEVAQPDPAAAFDAATAATADALWEERLERKRAEVNAVEGAVVEELNSAVASRVEAERRTAEEAQAAHLRALAERDEAIRRTQEEHAAAIEQHRQQIARQQAEYETRVRDCLRGVRRACAQPGE